MLASTKAGTLVEVGPGGERAAAQRGTTLEAVESGSLGRLVRLGFGDETRQLIAQQCGDGAIPARCQDSRLGDEVLVHRQSNVPLHRAPRYTLFTCRIHSTTSPSPPTVLSSRARRIAAEYRLPHSPKRTVL